MLAIPQELCDMIIDFLHDDVEELCSAGLVCKSWLPASRFHLFSEIWLGPKDKDALDVICAEGSTIPPYILDLRIVGDKKKLDSLVDDTRALHGEQCHLLSKFYETRFGNEILLRLPILSNLKTLWLAQINMENLTSHAKMKLIILLQNLTTLYVVAFNVRNCFSPYFDSFCLICDIGTV